jgi:hypothetical protein
VLLEHRTDAHCGGLSAKPFDFEVIRHPRLHLREPDLLETDATRQRLLDLLLEILDGQLAVDEGAGGRIDRGPLDAFDLLQGNTCRYCFVSSASAANAAELHLIELDARGLLGSLGRERCRQHGRCGNKE